MKVPIVRRGKRTLRDRCKRRNAHRLQRGLTSLAESEEGLVEERRISPVRASFC